MTCPEELTTYQEESLEFKPVPTLKPKVLPVYCRVPEAWLLCVLSLCWASEQEDTKSKMFEEMRLPGP